MIGNFVFKKSNLHIRTLFELVFHFLPSSWSVFENKGFLKEFVLFLMFITFPTSVSELSDGRGNENANILEVLRTRKDSNHFTTWEYYRWEYCQFKTALPGKFHFYNNFKTLQFLGRPFPPFVHEEWRKSTFKYMLTCKQGIFTTRFSPFALAYISHILYAIK